MPPYPQKYRVSLDLPESKFDGELELRQPQMTLAELAYTVLGVSGAASDSVALGAEKLGFKLACKKGCGACCRQLVPVSPPEALLLGELVEFYAEPRGPEIRARFAAAETRLADAGLMDRFAQLDDPRLGEADHLDLARDYFRLGLPCPFLEEESCGIYEFRPSICREYLVVSDPVNCQDPFNRAVNQLPLSMRLSDALSRVCAEFAGGKPKLIPLTLSLRWFREHQAMRDRRWGSKPMLDALMKHLNRAARRGAKPA